MSVTIAEIKIRDVNETLESRVSIFFLDPGKGISQLLRIARKQGLLWVNNCHLLLRACYQWITCLLHCSCGLHTRCTDAPKQKDSGISVAYLSGRGERRQMFLPPGADDPSYARPSSAHEAASVFLYRERERPLQCRRIVWPCPTVGLGSPVPGVWVRSAAIALHVCVLTRAPRRRRPGRCMPCCVPIHPRRRPTVQRCPTGGGERRFPGLSSGGRSAIAIPQLCSPRSPLTWPCCDV